jgi:hypothetical protein
MNRALMPYLSPQTDIRTRRKFAKLVLDPNLRIGIPPSVLVGIESLLLGAFGALFALGDSDLDMFDAKWWNYFFNYVEAMLLC